jgi:hypothetical protein
MSPVSFHYDAMLQMLTVDCGWKKLKLLAHLLHDMQACVDVLTEGFWDHGRSVQTHALATQSHISL